MKKLKNHLAQIPITPKQPGTFEMWEEILASAGPQDLISSDYKLSDLKNIEFSWQKSQVDLDSVFRPQIEIPSSPTVVNDLKLRAGGSSQNPIVLSFCSKTRKTRRNLLQQGFCLSVRLNLPSCSEVGFFGRKINLLPDCFIGLF